jgi:hypothetical protein
LQAFFRNLKQNSGFDALLGDEQPAAEQLETWKAAVNQLEPVGPRRR